MLENDVDLDAFCTNNASLTGNSLLILDIIREYRTEQSLPPAIRKFLAEVTLPVPACGIIQVNESNTIKILKAGFNSSIHYTTHILLAPLSK